MTLTPEQREEIERRLEKGYYYGRARDDIRNLLAEVAHLEYSQGQRSEMLAELKAEVEKLRSAIGELKQRKDAQCKADLMSGIRLQLVFNKLQLAREMELARASGNKEYVAFLEGLQEEARDGRVYTESRRKADSSEE